MAGRHRLRRTRPRVTGRRLLSAAVPVLAAAGLAAAVVIGGSAFVSPRPAAPDITSSAVGGTAPSADPSGTPSGTLQAGAGASRPSVLRRLPGAAPAAEAASGAVAAASARAAADREAAREAAAQQEALEESTETSAGAGSGVCDLEGPPRFDDPDHPNWITNRDCGYVDDQGRDRSRDPWIDGQMLSAGGN